MSQNAVLTEYEIYKSGLNHSLKIGLVSDLHERRCEEILSMLKEAKPDLIAVSGDTLERSSGRDIERQKKKSPIKASAFIAAYCIDRAINFVFRIKNYPLTENSYKFLSEASKLAPVFLSLGNHDDELNDEDMNLINLHGIHLLDNSDTVFDAFGQNILIGGLSSFYDEEWLERFSKKEGFKILLCHHPEYYDKMIKDSGIDLILSGHNHGGQIRVFGKGLLSSSGLFPKYDRGVFDNRLVVSTGCANTTAIPRFKNPRELVIINLIPAN